MVRLRALLDNDRFTFASIINIMKQLDLRHRRRVAATTRRETQVSAKSTRVTRHRKEEEQNEKEEEEKEKKNNKTPVAFTKNTLTERARSVSPNTLSGRKKNEDERGAENEPMEIEVDNGRQDLSMRDTVVNRAAFLHATAAYPSTTDRSASQLTAGLEVTDVFVEHAISNPNDSENDPRFYVCTTFASNSQETTTPCSVRSVVRANSRVASPSLSLLNSSQPFYDYCLSGSEFSPPSIESNSSEVARMTARSKEAAIFRQIEGDAFDEEAFLASSQVSLGMNLIMDNAMSP